MTYQHSIFGVATMCSPSHMTYFCLRQNCFYILLRHIPIGFISLFLINILVSCRRKSTVRSKSIFFLCSLQSIAGKLRVAENPVPFLYLQNKCVLEVEECALCSLASFMCLVINRKIKLCLFYIRPNSWKGYVMQSSASSVCRRIVQFT